MALSLAAGGALAAAPADEIAARRAEFHQLSRDVTLSSERAAALAAEVAALGKDRTAITAALIESARTERKLAGDIEQIEDRLAAMKAEESALRASLRSRRGVLAEVLGALQRMGLDPPPALLVEPEDALSSVRSAILLGAVVPELRAETETLVADLAELSRLAAAIEAEREKLALAAADQLAEQKRLALLVEEKQRLQGEAEGALAREQARAAELAGKARSLKDLIAGLEADAARRRAAEEAAAREAAAKAAAEAEAARVQAEAEGRQALAKAEAARLEAERRRSREEARLAATRRAAALAASPSAEGASLPVPESNRLAAAPTFSALTRQVALPVRGRFSRRFGEADGNGGVMPGDMLATQSGSIVTSPADGSVLYAGPFRSYGQLLILDAGDGYHIVLAGMSRINVAAGQSVMSGEPIGAMGETRLASIAGGASGATAAAELYVEFRKDGKPVDPAPWWAERPSGRTGNDS